jgi:hypothetical protein
MADPATRQIGGTQSPNAAKKRWGRPFQKGRSGNPGGKKKVPEDIVSLCREATPEAVQTWIKIMRNKQASFAVRAYCASQIVDRGYGKAPQQANLQITGPTIRAEDLSDDELAAIIARASPPLIEVQAVAPLAAEDGAPGLLPSDEAEKVSAKPSD